jgi:hypothetical protein
MIEEVLEKRRRFLGPVNRWKLKWAMALTLKAPQKV